MNKSINAAALGALLQGDIPNYIVANTPGGIEQQEKDGQTALVNSTLLPIEMDAKDIYEKWGFVFGDKFDDLFVRAKLPDGWKKVATDHDMWTSILDEKGRERVAIFYKAAFYDRSANMRLENRYVVMPNRTDTELTVSVMDNDTIIHTVGPCDKKDYSACSRLYKEAETYMTKHYPDWRVKGAYWDE